MQLIIVSVLSQSQTSLRCVTESCEMKKIIKPMAYSGKVKQKFLFNFSSSGWETCFNPHLLVMGWLSPQVY